MPPWLDSAEEAGVLISAVLAVLGAIVVGLIGLAGLIVTAYRAKLKPVLAATQSAAETAADQLTPNHGSSVRDALTRLEFSMGQLHSDLRLDREQVGRRLERLESYHSAHSPIQENTTP